MAGMTRQALVLSLAALLPACAAVVVPVPLPAPKEKKTTQLIGREPQEVVSLLGSPAFDRTEGTARQLQFKGGACVLDVFFYPDRRSGRVAATYTEARTPTGQPYDAQACTDSLAPPPSPA